MAIRATGLKINDKELKNMLIDIFLPVIKLRKKSDNNLLLNGL